MQENTEQVLEVPPQVEIPQALEVPMQEHALVPAITPVTKELVISTARSLLLPLGKGLGISRDWLFTQIQKMELNQKEVEQLIALRADYDASLPYVLKLMSNGYELVDLPGCYAVQKQFKELEKGVSIVKLLRLSQLFADAEPDPEFPEIIMDLLEAAHEVVVDRHFWLEYIDQTIAIRCAVGEKFGCATLEAAVSMIESRQPKRDGVVDRDLDEFERHRSNYEGRRRQFN